MVLSIIVNLFNCGRIKVFSYNHGKGVEFVRYNPVEVLLDHAAAVHKKLNHFAAIFVTTSNANDRNCYISFVVKSKKI